MQTRMRPRRKIPPGPFFINYRVPFSLEFNFYRGPSRGTGSPTLGGIGKKVNCSSWDRSFTSALAACLSALNCFYSTEKRCRKGLKAHPADLLKSIISLLSPGKSL